MCCDATIVALVCHPDVNHLPLGTIAFVRQRYLVGTATNVRFTISNVELA